WEGVSLHASGALALRVRLVAHGTDRIAIDATDATGSPVISVAALHDRVMAAAPAPAAPSAADALFVVTLPPAPVGRPPAPAGATWQVGPVAVLGAGLDDVDAVRVAALDALTRTEPMPDLVLVAGSVAGFVPGFGADAADKPGGPAGTRVATVRMLDLLQRWLVGDRFGGSRLVVVTCGAAGPEGTDLSGAGGWGLGGAAQWGGPGRVGGVG